MRILAVILISSAVAFAFNTPVQTPGVKQTERPSDSGISCTERATDKKALAACEHDAGIAAESRDDDQDAVVHYANALKLWQESEGARVANRIATLINLGGVYRRTHRYDSAQEVFSEAFQLAGASTALDPLVRATLLERSAWLDADLNRQDLAIGKLRQSQSLLERLDKGKEQLARTLDTLGILQLRAGAYKEGETNLRRAVTLATDVLGEEDTETANDMTDLALALTLRGQFAGAETLLRRSRLVIESHPGASSALLVPVFAELGSVERETGHYGLAEENTERALAILVHRLPYESPEVILTQVNLGSIYLRENKISEAERVLTPAVAAERTLFLQGRTLADGLRILGSLRVRENRPRDAEPLYREAVGLYETSIGGDHPDVAPVLLEYAGVLREIKGSKAEIKTLEARARAIRNRSARAS